MKDELKKKKGTKKTRRGERREKKSTSESEIGNGGLCFWKQSQKIILRKIKKKVSAFIMTKWKRGERDQGKRRNTWPVRSIATMS